MGMKDRIAEAKEMERLSGIKLEENREYKVEVISASLTKQRDTEYDCVTLQLKVIEGEASGKTITKNMIIDERTKNALQGKIGLGQLIKFLEMLGLSFEDEKSLAIALIDAKGKHLMMEVKKTPDKNDPKMVYTNYNFLRAV